MFVEEKRTVAVVDWREFLYTGHEDGWLKDDNMMLNGISDGRFVCSRLVQAITSPI